MLAEHPKEWWQGYNYHGPRTRNPYVKDLKTVQQSLDWLSGWLTKFYGESP